MKVLKKTTETFWATILFPIILHYFKIIGFNNPIVFTISICSIIAVQILLIVSYVICTLWSKSTAKYTEVNSRLKDIDKKLNELDRANIKLSERTKRLDKELDREQTERLKQSDPKNYTAFLNTLFSGVFKNNNNYNQSTSDNNTTV